MVDQEPGSVLDGSYEILGVLGSGGMGKVYKARQINLNRTVAIKIPSAQVLENPEYSGRFLREAHLCAQVSHPHIVSIYDVRPGPPPYIVMEYVDGMPLDQFLSEEATTIFVSDLLEIIHQMAQGIDAAHGRGIVHRDIKPANIVITSGNQKVKIMDFGIARASSMAALTAEGAMMGTPFYMAPEQVRGEEVTPAADLYAFGCVIYRLFTGHQVFTGEIASLLYKHVSTPPTPPSQRNPMLPPETDQVLLKALAKDARERFRSAGELSLQLRKALRPLSHLPYSQIFGQPEGLPTRKALSTPASPVPSLSNPPPLPGGQAITEPEPPAAPAIQPNALISREQAEKSRPSAPGFKNEWRVVVVCIPLLILSGGILAWKFWYSPLRSGSGRENRVVQEKPEETAQTQSSPSQGDASAAASLMWLGRKPAERYQKGDYLIVRWGCEPPESRPALYRVVLERTDVPDSRKTRRTPDENFVLKTDNKGCYHLQIQAESPKTSNIPGPELEARFEVE
ncbi:MAG TPA: protein kinase [Candidatus Sumerlaeota bacterium]|nr:protein kinase [Candidatus Sumerlaeota bacterium]